jgi:hypothetical protein
MCRTPVALLLALVLASCGGDDPPRAAPVASLKAYSASTNSMCAQLAAAVRQAFEDAPEEPDAALSRFARDVHDAGRTFSDAPPPPTLRGFHAAAVRHLALESATLRRAAELSAGGEMAEALRTLHLTGLLPEPIPRAVRRRAPACRAGVAPLSPADPPGLAI